MRNIILLLLLLLVFPISSKAMTNEPTCYGDFYLGLKVKDYTNLQLQTKDILHVYKIKGENVYLSIYNGVLVEICYDRQFDKAIRNEIEKAILSDSIKDHGPFDKEIKKDRDNLYIWYGEDVNMILFITDTSLKISFIHKNTFGEYVKKNKKMGV